MSWFKRSKKAAPDLEYRAAEPQDQECSCTSDSLSFEALFSSQYSSRSLSAVYACIELISNAVSSMPLRVVKESEDGSREVVKHHPVQRILRGRNVQTMTISAIIKSAIQDVLLHGNGYILIVRGETGLITSLRYLKASSVSVQYDDWKDVLYYYVTVQNSEHKTRFMPKDIIHLTKDTRDGVNGVSILTYAKDAVALARASEEAASNWFKSGMNVSGLLMCKTAMTEKQRTDIKNSWMTGRGQNTLQVLPLGLDYQALGVDAQKGQLIESRKHEINEIARYFGVPTQLIQSGEKLTYNSLEQLNLIFLQHTLTPYIINIEGEFTRKLFPEELDLVIDMDENEFLLRTDKASTAEYLSKLVGGGIMTVNEARKELGLGETADGDGLHIAYSDATKAEIGNNKPTNTEDETD